MVNLFEYFNSDTRELYETLRISGHHDETIVLVDDGFYQRAFVHRINSLQIIKSLTNSAHDILTKFLCHAFGRLKEQ